MVNQPSSPATSPPSTSTPSHIRYAAGATSLPDDSDTEFDPTPLQSPGGPDYDDLPPSYDEARHQAVSDARNGLVPLDPNQIEAHRLTLHEGPDEPEVWEYRLRGDELDTANEQAPDYRNVTNESGTTVPVQHVENSTEIPVGRPELRNIVPSVAPDRDADLLSRALNFTRHEPDADAQIAPRLARLVAIPQQDVTGAAREPVQFLRAYAQALHAHSIRPAEFMDFLEGLNALCTACGASPDDFLQTQTADATSSIVHDYITGANEAYFASRGLKVSLLSLSSLVQILAIPTERGQRAGAYASALDRSAAVKRRAQALNPWIEPMDTSPPASSTQSVLLREMAVRLKAQKDNENSVHASPRSDTSSMPEQEDPPHSAPETYQAESPYAVPGRRRQGGRGRYGSRRGPLMPFGAPGREPFGAPSDDPFGSRDSGLFARHGGLRQSTGLPRGSYGTPGYDFRSNGSNPSQTRNEWNISGESLDKWGEEFERRMGDLGQQFGNQAENWSQGVEKREELWDENVSARASGSVSGCGQAPTSTQVDDELPPSYDGGLAEQETDTLPSDNKGSHNPPKYDNTQHGKAHSQDHARDDDASSISSDSSDSDSESDSDDASGELPDTQAIFLQRVRSINRQAEDAARKGKKSPEEITQERALAIEKSQDERQDMDEKIEEKISKRAMPRALKQNRRDLLQEYRHLKRDLKAAHGANGKAKAKDKVKKTPEWKQAKREYKEKKKELRKETLKVRQEWREARSGRLKADRDARRRKSGGDQEDLADRMVWVVIENLHD